MVTVARGGQQALSPLARLALRLRLALIQPGGRLDAPYRRLLRPLGRRLLPSPPQARLLTVAAWPSPAPAPGPGWGAMRELLVVKLDHIGDFLLAIPAFTLLRRAFPAARLTLLCGPWNAELARSTGLFDRVVPLAFFAGRAEDPRPPLDRAALAALGAFDLAIDLRVDEDTRPVLSLLRARATAGYQASAGPPLTIALPRPPSRPDERDGLRGHQRQLLLDLAAAVLGADPADEAGAMLRRLAAQGAAHAPDMSAWARPVIAIATGSGRAIKNWPLDRFAALAARLHATCGGTIVLLGGTDGTDDAATLRAALPAGSAAALVDLVGRIPLAASFAVLAAADLYVGNDTALGHASAALGRPTLVLFSGIDPLPAWAPLGPGAVALKAEVTCSPCHLSDLARCPNGHLCMTALTVSAAAAQATRLLR